MDDEKRVTSNVRQKSNIMSRYLVLILFFFMYACNHPETSGLTDNEKDQVKKEIRATLKEINADIKRNGLNSELKYLDKSNEFFWVPPGYTSAISYDSVVRAIRRNAKIFKSVDQPFDTISIYPLAKDLATYTGRIHSTVIDTTGKVFESYLWETAVMVKRDIGWKLLSGQTTMLNK